VRKLLFLIVIFFILTGCRRAEVSAPDYFSDSNIYNVHFENEGISIRGVRICVVSIDGCEYLVAVNYGNAVSIIHKENCVNPEHK